VTGAPPPIALAALNALDAEAFTKRLGNVYEHAPWVAALAAAARPFATVTALYEALRSGLRAAAAAEQLVVISGHPDLAGKLARAGALTAESTGEQASAGLDRLGEAEHAAFLRLNDAYRAKFGFPFVICVRRHTKASILAGFETRLRNDADSERATALAEIDRIAALRLSALVTGEGALTVNGRLSTHVLDTHAGLPAAGLVVELRELAVDGAARLVVSTRTNSDGRTDAPLIAGRPVPIGQYELAFAVGDYFAARAVPLAEPPFLGIVPVRFAVAEAEGNYHVPLLVTPWSYATYRGS
jgi:2-oxo-4-hydroxy-4-carboxy-5-ureidoimidazoline decarboxylase